MGLCFSKISIVISQQCLLWSNGTFTFVLPHYIEYHASNGPTEHENLPVLIQYTDMGHISLRLPLICYVTLEATSAHFNF